MVKLATRALVYLHVPSKTPLFFDSDGRNKLFPTVYALWRVRRILAAGGEVTTAAAVEGSARSAACCGACPTLVVHPPVSKFVLNGADVMLPGARVLLAQKSTGRAVDIGIVVLETSSKAFTCGTLPEEKWCSVLACAQTNLPLASRELCS